MTDTCPVCGGPRRLELGGGREYTAGTVLVLLAADARWICPSGHVAEALADEAVVDTVVEEVRAAVPHARARRLRGGELCTACGQRLTMPVRRTAWPVPVDRPGGVPTVVTLHLDVPATRCPDCGVDHVPGRSQADVEAAVRGVLRRPDGAGGS
jgi:hypothetical protein